MDLMPIISRIASLFFGVLAGVFGFLCLYSFAKTDRKIPYAQARKRSIRKGFLFMTLTCLSFYVMLGFIQPDVLETIVFCFLGSLLIIALSYGIAYLQMRFLGKNEEARKSIDSLRDLINKK